MLWRRQFLAWATSKGSVLESKGAVLRARAPFRAVLPAPWTAGAPQLTSTSSARTHRPAREQPAPPPPRLRETARKGTVLASQGGRRAAAKAVPCAPWRARCAMGSCAMEMSETTFRLLRTDDLPAVLRSQAQRFASERRAGKPVGGVGTQRKAEKGSGFGCTGRAETGSAFGCTVSRLGRGGGGDGCEVRPPLLHDAEVFLGWDLTRRVHSPAGGVERQDGAWSESRGGRRGGRTSPSTALKHRHCNTEVHPKARADATDVLHRMRH